ncbi:unnamed protein product [Rhizophagus irregularis]|uniref:Uncharacterized protein n=1 Tax=Rhizophagus irregularis TaxID=588596 RepID=A0A916E1W2_9GLOM|nr:unnamed protein product [Rhizophagus irregularis]
MPNEVFQAKTLNNIEIKTSTNYISSSKVHQFKNLPEPKNATEEEQEAFHSKTYDFSIPYNIEDFNNSSDQKINKTSKINSIFKDDDEIHNNPYLHSEDQDEFEIPDDGF